MAAQPKRATSWPFLATGVAVGVVLVIAAFLAEPDYAWPVALLVALGLAAALAFRASTERAGASADADATDGVPRQEPRGERPLGDTPEAHDEINPHDLPLGHPGREKAEELAGGSEGTTRGPLPGG